MSALLIASGLLWVGFNAAPSDDNCDALRRFSDNNVTVLSTTISEGGVCAVSGVVLPVPGSRIGFELRLPSPHSWNGRIKMFGNGGYSSSMPIEALDATAAMGYVTVATDTGHQGDDPDFVVGRPEALVDWSYRAVHETIISAKAMTDTFYDQPASYSYFEGCSTGGHQAFSEVQRFPDDFDGVIAGAPGHNRIRLNAAFLGQFLVNHKGNAPSDPILTPRELRLLAEVSRKKCDTDPQTPYIDDPMGCVFDPGVLACDAVESADKCLMPRQVDVARTMYAGTRNPETGELIYPPWLPGSEAGGPVPDILPGWSLYWADPRRPETPARQSFWRFWVHDDAGWDWRDADLSTDVPTALGKLEAIVDATNTDLSGFEKAGGKLLHYHGLADPVVSPIDSSDYYTGVYATRGERTKNFYRLFMLPGVEHCRGGTGPDQFDGQGIIEAWVENGTAPDRLDVYYTGERAGKTLSLYPYTPE